MRRKRNVGKFLIFALLIATAIAFGKDMPSLERIVPDVKPREVPPVTALHPVVAQKQAELVAAAKRKGIVILITDGFRSVEEQNALYQQGRSTSGRIVTHAEGGESYHNYGLAIDFALRSNNGKAIWDMKFDGNGNGQSDWMEVVTLAKQLGFTWGGDWHSFPDYPHLQMDFGYSIRELRRGERPPALNS
ncbi:M15 family metallopeptidase [Paenibacillus xerothermodurans]|uniref:M15 family peptidase n=1 Tax=Paenibacillus xerothermodurans TaxID=1977292 RepID=A0A2W1NB12_PAEXE|nr:M15 family metallopeptidase [Paenibacillus xerothermodurans]PZE21607.1 M15 family peptidase [Paenibacillus xerothermodurans]